MSACLGKEGCLAGEFCLTTEECVAGDECVFAPEIYGNVTVCSSTSAQSPLIAWIFVSGIMATAVFFCLFVALRNAQRLRAALKRRAEKKKNQAKGIQNNGTPLQKRCEKLLSMSKEISNAFNSQLEDVHKLYLQEDKKQTSFMFHYLVLATMNCAFNGNQQFTYMYERRLWFLATYLEQAAQGIWYAMNPDNDVQTNRMALTQTQQLLIRTAEYFQLPSPFSGIQTVQVMTKRHDDPQFGAQSPKMKQLEARALAFQPAFVAPTQSGGNKDKPLIFRQIRRFKAFYGTLFLIGLSIFLAFAVKINTDNDNLDKTGRRGGYGQTFLPVPPQYDIAASPVQGVVIPILYGIMHNALFCLGILPIPLARGFWRDIVDKFPSTRKYMPVDDLVSLHRQIAYAMFTFLFVGALMWTITMTIECNNNVPRACLAFTPAVNNFFDPVENVFALRFSVFLLWPWMGLLYFARDGAPWPFKKVKFFQEKWYEFCYFLHTTIAHATLILALVARFEVFHPVLAGWSVYWLDYFRETVLYSQNADLIDAQMFGRAQTGVPTSLRLKILPNGPFKTGAGQYCYIKVPQIDNIWHPFTLASASNDKTVQLHIGIIAGKDDWQRNTKGQFTAGEWESKKKTWTYNLFKAVSARGKASIPVKLRGPYGCSFESCFDPSFSGAVVIAAGTGLTAAESVLRESLERKKAGMPGPGKLWVVYSCREEDSLIWCWERIISLLVKAVEDGVLDINALSPRSNLFDWIGIQMYVTQSNSKLLKEFTELNQNLGNKVFNLRESIFARATIKRGNGQVNPQPQQQQFQKQQQQQQMQAYNQMEQGNATTYPAPLRKAIQSIQYGSYTDLDLGQTRAASRTNKRETLAGKVREWLLNKVLSGSLDDEETHIERFLLGCCQNIREGGNQVNLSVGFCGPTPLSITVSEAIRAINSSDSSVNLEFSAESQ